LFLGAIIDVGYVIMFRKNTCWIVVATSPHKILVVGHKDSMNGLYKLELKLPQTHQQASSQLFLAKDNQLWSYCTSEWATLGFKDCTNFFDQSILVECPTS
jgi:hypothetical protein